MNIRELLGKQILFFDGGMGTQLQELGLKIGELPEIWNITHYEDVKEIHRSYLKSGANIILTNTFGANHLKFNKEPFLLSNVVNSGIKAARTAVDEFNSDTNPCYVALDLGPTGKLLKPMGDLDFEECVSLYKEIVSIGVNAGVDLILIETMSDTLEIKAAIIACKECCDLPILASMVFDQNGKLLTGGNPQAIVALLEGLGVDALGINCGLGPIQMLPLVKEIVSYASIPVIVSPNAGLPVIRDSKTYFDIDAIQFSHAIKEIIESGASIVGGCCGTTPEHISKMTALCKDLALIPIKKKTSTIVSSYSHGQEIGDTPVIIGERINPTGKKVFKQALIENNLDYILGEGIKQQENGAHILDVNVGLPDIDEVEMLTKVVMELQSISPLPLQIDTSDISALESALRIYNGKALINSVNGKAESMKQVFPLVKKYGGVVVGLTLDENGIPQTPEGRLAVAEKIVNTAKEYGIDKKDVIIDVLTMTISAQPDSAKITLKALEMVREKLNVHTVLGVSNISFGLPRRELINSNFFMLALKSGLSSAIINPGSLEMMASYHSYCALMALDTNCISYINAYSDTKSHLKILPTDIMDLSQAVEYGFRESARCGAVALIESGENPLDIISKKLIPALDKVGKGFETKTIFLPQLLMSAEAAKVAFSVISDAMIKSGAKREKGEKIVLATVKGDIHDIGKNIVKVLLENYGYDVIDLGKDVSPQLIVNTVVDKNIKLVGLSALMTTTVIYMKETIDLLHKEAPWCKIVVGGAVLTDEYAMSIGANKYASDAMSTVNFSREVL